MNSIMPKCKTSLDTSTDKIMEEFCLIGLGRPFQVQTNKTFANSEGTEIYLQKQLILCSLQYVFLRLKEQNLQKRPCFSKFAYLWPKSNVLAGVSGVHAVCTCELTVLGKLHDMTMKWQLIMTFIQNWTSRTIHKMIPWRLWSMTKELTYHKYWTDIGKQPKTV